MSAHIDSALAGITTTGLAVALVLGIARPAFGDDGARSSESHWTEVAPTSVTEPQPQALLGAPLTSVRIAGSALTPRETNVNRGVNISGGCGYVTGGAATTVWNHKAPLPQGAVVNTLRMYYSDTSASNSSAWFTVYDLYGNIVDEWSVASTGSAGNSFNDSAVIDHTIDYSTYSYLINWRPNVVGSTMQLCGFRIFYVDPVIFRNGFELGG